MWTLAAAAALACDPTPELELEPLPLGLESDRRIEAVALTDLDRDGRDDIVVLIAPQLGATGPLELLVLRSSEDGVAPQPPRAISGPIPYPSTIALALHADRDIVVVVDHGGTNRAFVTRGELGTASELELGLNPAASVLTELGGAPTLIAAAASGALEVRTLDTHEVEHPTPLPPGTTALAAADVSGDGTADLIAASPAAITLRLGPTLADEPVRKPPRKPIAVAGGDLDGDGTAEIVAADAARRALRFVDPPGWGPASTTRHGPLAVLAPDLDGDGCADPALLDTDRTLTVGRAAPGRTLRNAGQLRAAVGDLDGDGRDELVVVRSASALSVVRARQLQEVPNPR